LLNFLISIALTKKEKVKVNIKALVPAILPRLAILFIGLPLVCAIVIFLPQRNHLVLNVLVSLMSALGAWELAGMFAKKNTPCPRKFAAFLALLPPLMFTLLAGFGLPVSLAAGILLGVLLVLAKTVFPKKETLEERLPESAALLSCLLYPGVPLACIIALAQKPNATFLLLFFLCVSLGNDSFSWFFGVLLGRNNRGITHISPQKSIAGYAGGMCSATLIGIGAAAFYSSQTFYNVFYEGGVVVAELASPRYILFAVIAFCTSLAANVGDLAESALKRSAGVKDSGAIFPGRGGVLDSLDSLSFAAPVFYYLYEFFARHI
jgi:phosphatidate cytidylyltransferase